MLLAGTTLIRFSFLGLRSQRNPPLGSSRMNREEPALLRNDEYPRIESQVARRF